jgi:ATP-dependent DNA helicase RecG
VKTALAQLNDWLTAREDEHLEFKEARNNFHFEKLVKYCSALANEGGGRMILGVTNARPRRIVGSSAFPELERTKAGLIERLHLRINATELPHPDGRVLVFDVPPRPIGFPIQFEGAYWMRAGEDLVPMTADMLKRIFEEAAPDMSAEICPAATLADLDATAIEQFHMRWGRRTRNDALGRLAPQQLLSDSGLVDGHGVTYAALILLGTRTALARHLADAEVVFEYRSSETAGPANQRENFRLGFLLFCDRLWELINLRNDTQHFQDGLLMHDVPTFSEGAVREAILNAVSHRDYRRAGSVFVRQYPRRIEVVSPGGFPVGITVENILNRQAPRNRRIAETLERCGLVERAGQGANRMFEESIRQAKPLPDFTGTDEYQVALTLHGEVQDPAFLRFLEQVGQERARSFTTEDLLVLDGVRRGLRIPPELRTCLDGLLQGHLVECHGRGRGVKYLLSRRYYRIAGKKGVYTRERGLDRDTKKALLLKHVKENAAEGAKLADLAQVLPALSSSALRWLLREMQAAGLIHVIGRTSAARWFPGPGADEGAA